MLGSTLLNRRKLIERGSYSAQVLGRNEPSVGRSSNFSGGSRNLEFYWKFPDFKNVDN